MENIEFIIQAISTIGFPCAMCLLLMYYVKYVTEKHNEETKELTASISSLRDILIKIESKLEE